MSDKLLEVKNLSVEYDTEISTVYAVNGLDLDLNYGETLGLVGETGAGKTTTALSVIQLLPEGIGFVTDGSIKLDGVDMLNAPEEKIRAMRGSVVSMIFQDPMSALNPVMTVGAQIMEVLKIHHPEQSTAQLGLLQLRYSADLPSLSGRPPGGNPGAQPGTDARANARTHTGTHADPHADAHRNPNTYTDAGTHAGSLSQSFP